MLQRKAAGMESPGPVPPAVGETLRSPGHFLDPAARASLEPRFGHDFSRVRIHTDAGAAESARLVNARAYTVGRDIVFAAGQYQPASPDGRRLLAHELAHVAQQGGFVPPMRSTPGGKPGAQQGGSVPERHSSHGAYQIDDSHEREADRVSEAVLSGAAGIDFGRTSAPHLARKENDYAESKKQILAELNRSMPAAILGMIDGLDRETRVKLASDPDVVRAIAALPSGSVALIRKHFAAAQPADFIDKPAAGSGAGAMSRAAFESVMKQRYRVKDIHTGTFQEQQFGDMKESDWHVWHPGSSSETYTWIVEAFQNFEKTFGGIPPVDKIVFFESEYSMASPGHAVKNPGVLSSYALGMLTIYKGVTTSNNVRLDTKQFIAPTAVQSVHGNITHELGHGISEIALDQSGTGPAGQDPQLYVDYRKAVGWTASGAAKLYDIQAPGVAQTLSSGSLPPSDLQITEDNWDLDKWKERPVTAYMAANPADDFSEAISAYVNHPDALKRLSPARYKFIDERKAKWGPAAKQHLNVWEAAKKGGQPRTLLPAEKPNVWEQAKQGQVQP